MRSRQIPLSADDGNDDTSDTSAGTHDEIDDTDRSDDETAARKQDIQEELKLHYDRLQLLKRQIAVKGKYNADPRLLMEVEDLKVEIEDLKAKLKELDG